MPSVVAAIEQERQELVETAVGERWKRVGVTATDQPVKVYVTEREGEEEASVYRMEFGGGSVTVSHPYIRRAKDDYYSDNMALFRISSRADVKLKFYGDSAKQEVWLHSDPGISDFDEVLTLENLTLDGDGTFRNLAGEVVALVPTPVIRAINTETGKVTTTTGTVSVLPHVSDDARVLRISVDPAWLAERFAAGDVVVIDPTLVVASSGFSSTPSGHRIARLSDGTHYAVSTASGSNNEVYVNKGTGWTKIAGVSMVSALGVDLTVDADGVLWCVVGANYSETFSLNRWVPSADRLSFTSSTALTIQSGSSLFSRVNPRIVVSGTAGSTKTLRIGFVTVRSTDSNEFLDVLTWTVDTGGAVTGGGITSWMGPSPVTGTRIEFSVDASGNAKALYMAGSSIYTRPADSSAPAVLLSGATATNTPVGISGLSTHYWLLDGKLWSTAGLVADIGPTTTIVTGDGAIAAVGVPSLGQIAVIGRRGTGLANAGYPGLWVVNPSTGGVTDRGAIETTVAYSTNLTHSMRVVESGNAIPFLMVGASGVYSETVTLNQAPTAPTSLTRDNYDATGSAAFTWTHNDADGDAQASYQLLIVKASDGTTAYDSGKVASSTQSHTLAAGTLTNNTQYQWKVRTWDSSDVVGPYSTLATFWCSAKPTAAITNPASDGATVSSSSFTATGTISDPESEGSSAYQWVLTTAADVIVTDYGKVTSTNPPSVNISGLANGSSYKLKLTGWDAKGVASVQVVRTFTVSYTPVSAATTGALGNDDGGYIGVTWTNPVGAIATSYVDLYRRESGGAFGRIATQLPANSSYDDYAVASGKVYDYKVTAVGANGTATDSNVASASVTLSGGLHVHDPLDASGTYHLFQFREVAVQDTRKTVSGEFRFVGRTAPVVNFDGNMRDRNLRVRIALPDDTDDRSALEGFFDRMNTVCVRDHRGRKVWGVLRELPITDERWGGWCEVDVFAVAYEEGV
jgi:hypothetical protein